MSHLLRSRNPKLEDLQDIIGTPQARHGLATLFHRGTAACIFVACCSTANAANYQTGLYKDCPAATTCQLNFPGGAGNLRIDYVTCRLVTSSAASLGGIDLFNGTHAVYLDVRAQDTLRKTFTASNQMKYFAGSGPFTITGYSGNSVDNLQLACTVSGSR